MENPKKSTNCNIHLQYTINLVILENFLIKILPSVRLFIKKTFNKYSIKLANMHSFSLMLCCLFKYMKFNIHRNTYFKE